MCDSPRQWFPARGITVKKCGFKNKLADVWWPGFGVYLSPNNEFSIVSKIDCQESQLKYNVYFSMRLCFSFPPWAGLIETQGNQVARPESCPGSQLSLYWTVSIWLAVCFPFCSPPPKPPSAGLPHCVREQRATHFTYFLYEKRYLHLEGTRSAHTQGSPNFHILPTSHLSLMTWCCITVCFFFYKDIFFFKKRKTKYKSNSDLLFFGINWFLDIEMT